MARMALSQELNQSVDPSPQCGKDKFWAEMDASEQNAAKVLGYTQKSWDEGDPTPMNDLYWESPHHRDESGNLGTTMTPEQIAAVKLLGHTRETWNHGMTEDEAATKIAAMYRGRSNRARSKLKALRATQNQQGAAAGAAVAKSPLVAEGATTSSAKATKKKSRLCCCLDRKPGYAPAPQSDQPKLDESLDTA